MSDRFELAPDGPIQPNLSCVKIRRDDKEVFDALQQWWSFRRGKSLTQWEAFTFMMDALLEHPEVGREFAEQYREARAAS